MTSTFIQDFEVLGPIGSGSFASVFKVKRVSDDQVYALKQIKLLTMKSKNKQNALNEIRILASIDDQNIIKYKQAFFDDKSQSLCIVMEYAPDGDLLKKITSYKKKTQHMPEHLIWSYLIQILQGLKTLHEMNILHRDLKSANIFLADNGKTAKLGDLNVSKITEEGLARTQAGTPYYASPEVWEDKPYGNKSDIWSVGCVVYEMCAQKPPFRAQDIAGLYGKIIKGVYSKIPSVYSAELAKIIALCLTTNPEGRPDCQKLLSHPYIVARMSQTELKKSFVMNDLLEPIKMPKNLKDFSYILPKPQYKKEIFSLNDLDSFGIRNREFVESRPFTRQARHRHFTCQGKPVKAVFHNGVKLDENKEESSIERIIKDHERNYSIEPEQNNHIPSLNLMNLKKSPMQRGGKGMMLMDICKTRREGNRLPFLSPRDEKNHSRIGSYSSNAKGDMMTLKSSSNMRNIFKPTFKEMKGKREKIPVGHTRPLLEDSLLLSPDCGRQIIFFKKSN